MKLHEKIGLLRRESNLKLVDLHRRITQVFGKNAITYRSLHRIQAGQADGKASSLHQICVGLGIKMRDLYAGVDEEMQADHIKREKSEGRYVYSNDAYAEIFSNRKVDFFAIHLVVNPQGRTKSERDPQGEQRFIKWVYMLMGRITCVVNDRRITLKKGDSFCFDSRKPHYFENNTQKKARAVIIQSPRRI